MANISNLESDILLSIDENFRHQIDFTKSLISFPSTRGNEQTAQTFIEQTLSERGYKLDKWAIDINEIKNHPGFSPSTISYENSFNVVASHVPREVKGKSLILNGHIDVVPSGPDDMWSRSPFDPWVEGDWMYGRGSGDMKAGLAANIFALDAIRKLGYQPAAPLYIQSVIEEECTGNGALACLQRGYRADAAIIPEPKDNKLVRANVGVLWCRIHLSGEPVHTRVANSGVSAIDEAYHIMSALRDLAKEWNEQKYKHQYFREVESPINVVFGQIRGGDWASMVPAWCWFDVRIAIYPGTKASDAAVEIESCIARASLSNSIPTLSPPKIEYTGFFAEGYVLEEGSLAEKTLSNAHHKSFGSELESFVTPGYLDGRVFVLYDNCPCLVYGPYSENIHGIDERVSLSSIKKITGSIALFIAEWCNLEKIK